MLFGLHLVDVPRHKLIIIIYKTKPGTSEILQTKLQKKPSRQLK